MLSNSQCNIFTSSKKALEDNMTLTVNKCVKLKSKQTFYILENLSFTWACQPPYKLYWSRSMTFKYDSCLWGIFLLILSDILTRRMTFFNGILGFELISSNEIFIRSNKIQHYFLQFDKVINGIFILILVIFGTYQIICELFLLRSTIESLVVSCSA